MYLNNSFVNGPINLIFSLLKSLAFLLSLQTICFAIFPLKMLVIIKNKDLVSHSVENPALKGNIKTQNPMLLATGRITVVIDTVIVTDPPVELNTYPVRKIDW